MNCSNPGDTKRTPLFESLFVNLIPVPVSLFVTHIFLHLSLLLLHHSAQCSIITPSLFHSRPVYNLPVSQILPTPAASPLSPDCFHGLLPSRFFPSYPVFFYCFLLYFSAFWCCALQIKLILTSAFERT